MADFEDSLSPTWQNLLEGQFNLNQANKNKLILLIPKVGKIIN